MKLLKTYVPYIIALVTFVIVSLLYFLPVIHGKEILQSDIVQFTGMSKEIQDYRAEYGEEPYWTDAAFGGMPAYQVSAKYANDFIKYLDETIRFLPRPADYLFLYFIGFFVLMLALKVDWRLALIGSLAFGLTTYYVVILGVGHNAKAHAIGYFSLVLAGLVWAYRKKYFLGFIVTALATALEIIAGHIQMTYYLFIVLFLYAIVEMIKAIQNKTILDFVKSSIVVLVAGILAIGMNANHLLPTREYTTESTRSVSELTINPDGSPKETTTALDKSYITEYSYGIAETFNLFIPRLMGGSNAEAIGTKSETYRFLKPKIGIKQAKDFSDHAPMYWGNQPIVAAPAYIGAVLIFLFVLALHLIKPLHKWWLLGAIILSLFLSWGKNFNFLTDFFIDYVPLYDKFRAVSSIQVIIEWLVPIVGVLGLQQFFFNKKISDNQRKRSLLNSLYITGGIALIFVVLGSSLFTFESPSDAQYEGMLSGITDALIQDRKHLMMMDALRTLVLVGLSFAMLWFFLKRKLNTTLVIVGLGLLLFFDGFQVAKRYVNDDDFVRSSMVKKPFEPSAADLEILKDTTHYRVANFTVNPMIDGSTSYFHNSIGGYHAAKPRRYQEIFDYQISNGNFEILNMLNTKYFIVDDEANNRISELNDQAYGNAWFAYAIKWVNNADEAMKALDSINKETAVLDIKYKPEIPENLWIQDSTATVDLVHYKPNHLIYQSKSHIPQLVIFSEQYYPHGWQATVDGKPQEILRANYILRALVVPEGEHKIEFSFEPEIVKQGEQWSKWSYIIFISLVIMGVIFRVLRKK